MKSRKSKIQISRAIKQKAVKLVNDARFLYKACRQIGKLGVVGEKRNRLIFFLAGIGRTLPEPASVLLKGPPSCGKSTTVKTALKLFPQDSIVERAGLSKKALVYGKGSLARKIFYLHEYRCGKDAQQLLRLQQSEGKTTHEATTITARRRGTKVVQRLGSPVVMSTTTDEKVFADDEARFLSTWVDDSPEQNLAVMIATTKRPKTRSSKDLAMWRTATSLIAFKAGDFEMHPEWLQYVAKCLPSLDARVRRDWGRFLTFCSAIALCRSYRDGHPTNIEFRDYCVAHRIFEPVFASILRRLPSDELKLAKAVATVTERSKKRGATAREIARELHWDSKKVYKLAHAAEQSGLIEYEQGTREHNVKPIRARDVWRRRFLPSPRNVLRRNPQIGKKVKYIDPFTGKWKVVKR